MLLILRFRALLEVTLIALAPFLLHGLNNAMGLHVFPDSVSVFLLVFVLCGVAAGALRGYSAMVGGPVAYVLAMAVLTKMRFLGGGGDGDMYYVLAFAGEILFCIAVGVFVLFRRRIKA